ncbi:MAG: putative FAD-dependent dehydrogenase, partial [Glaciecola sp.]
AINKEHIVNPESNYCFGEGGAGTYSDGKLYTRSNKRGDVNKVLKQLVAFGATENILIDAHPHIGTNKLPEIITSMRDHIISCGGEVMFNCKLTDVIVKDNKITTAIINGNKELEAQNIILATGHSARDIFRLLHDKNILIENKPFALGVRVEHPQIVVDQAQYNAAERSELLPPASYSLVAQTGEKAVYSFCMCPGGIIAPCATSPGEIVTNGWSPSKRNNPYANSGIVVPVDESDWGIYNGLGPLAAMKFQSTIEQKAFELGGKTQTAPAQRLKDFVEGKTSSDLPKTSYQPGITSVDMCEVLPEKFHKALRLGFKDFGKKMRNFLSNDAVIHGVESRTSSPVRIPRNKENLQHPQISNLYPCGEGAGYAGGIMSAAIDGQKCAKAIAAK